MTYFEILGGPLDGSSFGVEMGSGPPPDELYWSRNSNDDRIAVHLRRQAGKRWIYEFDGWNTTKELGHEHVKDD